MFRFQRLTYQPNWWVRSNGMSRHLAQLLNKSEDVVASAIHRLESATGLPGEDIRLLHQAKLLQKQKIASLGLDPDDTTAAELYHSLQSKYAEASQQIDKALSIDEQTALIEKIRKASMLVKHALDAQDLWVIKAAPARQLLRQSPPRKLMKRLGYRTVGSMLKREAVEGLMLAANLTESSTWQSNIRRASSRLDTSQFELRPLSLICLDPAKFEDLTSSQPTIYSRIVGSAALLPSSVKDNDALSMSLALLNSTYEMTGVNVLEKLLSANPALHWWSGLGHLIYSHDDQYVSFNIHDVAVNYCQATEFHEAQQTQAQQSLWQELTKRYHNYSDKVAEILPQVEADLGQKVETAVSPIPQQLATETVEA